MNLAAPTPDSAWRRAATRARATLSGLAAVGVGYAALGRWPLAHGPSRLLGALALVILLREALLPACGWLCCQAWLLVEGLPNRGRLGRG